jgi:flagellar assembly factor FliW
MNTAALRRQGDSGSTRIVTRFGEFDAEPADALSFPHGLPGFEQCRQFVLLSAEDLHPLQCLHAVAGPPASFLVIDPRVVWPRYRCVLRDADRARLGASADTPLVWLGLVAIDEGGAASVNLRAPVVINPERMLGFQFVPHDTLYPLRHPVAAS